MYYTVIKHDRHLRTRGKCSKHEPQVECSQMAGVFYHSVIHGLGFFICFKIQILRTQNNKTPFFSVLYSDKTWVFDQSERAQGPIYIINQMKYSLFIAIEWSGGLLLLRWIVTFWFNSKVSMATLTAGNCAVNGIATTAIIRMTAFIDFMLGLLTPRSDPSWNMNEQDTVIL